MKVVGENAHFRFGTHELVFDYARHQHPVSLVQQSLYMLLAENKIILECSVFSSCSIHDCWRAQYNWELLGLRDWRKRLKCQPWFYPGQIFTPVVCHRCSFYLLYDCLLYVLTYILYCLIVTLIHEISADHSLEQPS